MTTEQLLEAARELANQLSSDIQLATTREEHIRVTARANAAAALHNGLLNLENGMFLD
jgi:hypothetical protein